MFSLTNKFVRNGITKFSLNSKSNIINYNCNGIRFQSNDTINNTNNEGEVERVLIYEGRYWKSLRRIRRVSVGSCITGCTIVPIGLMENSESISQMGQLGILGVTILITCGSTIGLNYLSHTYVSRMYKNISSNTKKISEYSVDRLNILGNSILDEPINLKDCVKTNAFQHPFSNFKTNNKYYYISTPAISDENERQIIDDAVGVAVVSNTDTKK